MSKTPQDPSKVTSTDSSSLSETSTQSKDAAKTTATKSTTRRRTITSTATKATMNATPAKTATPRKAGLQLKLRAKQRQNHRVHVLENSQPQPL